MTIVQGKKRGKLYVWEGSAKQGVFRKSFSLAFYPVVQELRKGNGFATFDRAASSNIGGQLQVVISARSTGFLVEINGTYPHGHVSRMFGKHQKATADIAYSRAVRDVKAVKSLAGIKGVFSRRKKQKAWR